MEQKIDHEQDTCFRLTSQDIATVSNLPNISRSVPTADALSFNALPTFLIVILEKVSMPR